MRSPTALHIADAPREDDLQENMIKFLESEVLALKQRLSKYEPETVNRMSTRHFVRYGTRESVTGTPELSHRETPVTNRLNTIA